jgi:hypothetical protein
MAHAHTSYARNGLQRPSPALFKRVLQSAIASLVVACSGGGVGGGGGGVGGGVECAAGPSPAVLAWDAVVDPDLGGYRIYAGTTSGTYLPLFDVAFTETTVPVPGLSSGTTYYFAATAYRMSDPTKQSAFSNEVCKKIP